MIRPGHPSTRKLMRWIDGSDAALDRHLDNCSYCADRLESLLDDSDASVQEALLQLLEVPKELPARLHESLDERLSNQQDLTLVAEFFGLPFRTIRVFTATDQGDD